jgi:hypothetical protein
VGSAAFCASANASSRGDSLPPVQRGILICPGDVAQLGERCNRTAEVVGSNPIISTRFS